MNAEIDDLLSAALSAVHAAQAALRKGASPRDLDVLRKSDLSDDHRPRASRSDDVLARTLDALADLERRAAAIEGARDMDSQTARKTWTIS
jgi:hypothetical protein